MGPGLGSPLQRGGLCLLVQPRGRSPAGVLEVVALSWRVEEKRESYIAVDVLRGSVIWAEEVWN